MSAAARQFGSCVAAGLRACRGLRIPTAGRDACRYTSCIGAFTLIELMVVIGLIILLVSGLSLSLGDTAGNSLGSAQTMIGSLVGSARAQAALNQTEARLIVYAACTPTGDTEKYL